jgi:hypothetical protein
MAKKGIYNYYFPHEKFCAVTVTVTLTKHHVTLDGFARYLMKIAEKLRKNENEL